MSLGAFHRILTVFGFFLFHTIALSVFAEPPASVEALPQPNLEPVLIPNADGGGRSRPPETQEFPRLLNLPSEIETLLSLGRELQEHIHALRRDYGFQVDAISMKLAKDLWRRNFHSGALKPWTTRFLELWRPFEILSQNESVRTDLDIHQSTDTSWILLRCKGIYEIIGN